VTTLQVDVDSCVTVYENRSFYIVRTLWLSRFENECSTNYTRYS